MLALAAGSLHSYAANERVTDSAPAAQAPTVSRTPPRAADPVVTPDFPAVSKAITDAIAAHQLPGAVVAVGHAGKVVFQRAYGSRKLAGEPGLDGKPAPAEPMTEDTIFDMASLTKPLATATAVMQLYEQGKVGFDDPLQKYLPEFNTTNDPQRARVTIRMLLTHTSGTTGDVELKDPWGLDRADKAEGIHRALITPLESRPGQGVRYSDINFILLGALLEKLTGEPEDVYVQQNVFVPLGMDDTRYLPPAKACGPHTVRGVALVSTSGPGRGDCPAGTWSTEIMPRIAPTAHDDESAADPGKNPDFDRLLRGTVHDPTTRRMGGVAGHAGVFSTVHDVNRFAQALLDRLAGRPSTFPLRQATLQVMTAPQQPGHTDRQLRAANAIVKSSPQRHPAVRGESLRGFGWDIDTVQSKPRGAVFPVGSFGHTGFTGTSLWIDPGSDTYVIVLANVIHQRGGPPILNLAGEVATAAARQLGLYR